MIFQETRHLRMWQRKNAILARCANDLAHKVMANELARIHDMGVAAYPKRVASRKANEREELEYAESRALSA